MNSANLRTVRAPPTYWVSKATWENTRNPRVPGPLRLDMKKMRSKRRKTGGFGDAKFVLLLLREAEIIPLGKMFSVISGRPENALYDI